MRTNDTTDRIRGGRPTGEAADRTLRSGEVPGRARTRPGAGALLAVAAGAAFLVAACSASSSAAGGGATTGPAGGASAAPAASTEMLGGGYDYNRTQATQVPAATAGAPGAGGALEVGLATDASVGSFLTGPNGMTLYVFTKDGLGRTVCYDQCAANWPPLTVTAGETVKGAAKVGGTFGTITRTDGATQVTYNDQPLYYYVADRKAGDVVGQGVGGVWFVAAP